MTNSTQKFANGSTVNFKGQDMIVTGYAKGWYTLTDGEGNQESKARANSLKAVGGIRNMAETLRKYVPNYVGCDAYSGRKSLNNGDAVAEFLEGKSPMEVIKAAEQILGLESGELVAKYENLNPGQQRMNGGNRIRAALKRGDITAADLH